MAKRTRGSNRPGQRHSDKRAPVRPQPRPATRPDQDLTQQEEANAAELESQIVARDKAAATSVARPRDRARATEPDRSIKPKGQGILAARAAEEYGYVVRDVRRILRWGGVMVATLAVLFVLVDVMHVITP